MRKRLLRQAAGLLAALTLALLLAPLAANICLADHACAGGCCEVCELLKDQMERSLALACALPMPCLTSLPAANNVRAPAPISRLRDMRAASPVECKVRMND